MPRKKMVAFTIGENGCYCCNSHSLDSGGYPQMRVNGKKTNIHRHIYIECFGEIPTDMVVRHKCDNRLCVNPEHLELGTHIENMSDMVTRKRSLRGERHTASVLTEDDVREIRANNTNTLIELAEKYGVTYGTIHKAKIGRTWKHV